MEKFYIAIFKAANEIASICVDIIGIFIAIKVVMILWKAYAGAEEQEIDQEALLSTFLKIILLAVYIEIVQYMYMGIEGIAEYFNNSPSLSMTFRDLLIEKSKIALESAGRYRKWVINEDIKYFMSEASEELEKYGGESVRNFYMKYKDIYSGILVAFGPLAIVASTIKGDKVMWGWLDRFIKVNLWLITMKIIDIAYFNMVSESDDVMYQWIFVVLYLFTPLLTGIWYGAAGGNELFQKLTGFAIGGAMMAGGGLKQAAGMASGLTAATKAVETASTAVQTASNGYKTTKLGFRPSYS